MPFCVYAITGHRPPKFSGYSDSGLSRVDQFALSILSTLTPTPSHLIIGMALGWDQSCAMAAYSLNIPYTAAIPCAGQESPWSDSQKSQYYFLLDHAKEQRIISPGAYAPHKMMIRNMAMCETAKKHSGKLLAAWDGGEGGTGHCISYAQGLKLEIVNVWDKWKAYK